MGKKPGGPAVPPPGLKKKPVRMAPNPSTRTSEVIEGNPLPSVPLRMGVADELPQNHPPLKSEIPLEILGPNDPIFNIAPKDPIGPQDLF